MCQAVPRFAPRTRTGAFACPAVSIGVDSPGKQHRFLDGGPARGDGCVIPQWSVAEVGAGRSRKPTGPFRKGNVD